MGKRGLQWAGHSPEHSWDSRCVPRWLAEPHPPGEETRGDVCSKKEGRGRTDRGGSGEKAWGTGSCQKPMTGEQSPGGHLQRAEARSAGQGCPRLTLT